MQKQQKEPLVPFCVLRLVLDTGERLPCLVVLTILRQREVKVNQWLLFHRKW